jgi:hypothetical protein
VESILCPLQKISQSNEDSESIIDVLVQIQISYSTNLLYYNIMIPNTLKASDHDVDDIVTINAGGKMFQVLRSTLCLPPGDTAFTKLFSTSNSHSYSYNTVKAKNDANDNVFLDYDPQLIEIIINFLRIKSIEDPFDPIVEPPEVPVKKMKHFRRLLNHFGLTAFFYYPSVTLTSNCSVSSTSSTASNEGLAYQPVQKMSLESHEVVMEASSSTTKESSSFQDSFTGRTTEVNSIADNSIAQTFDYCYG